MVFGGGRTSRLYRDLVYTRQIAQDAMAGQRSSQIAGVFDIMLTPRPAWIRLNSKRRRLNPGRNAEKRHHRGRDVPRQDFNCFILHTRHGNIGGFGGLADRINAYQHMLGRPDGFAADLQRYLDLDRAMQPGAAAVTCRAPGDCRVLPAGRTRPPARCVPIARRFLKGNRSCFRSAGSPGF